MDSALVVGLTCRVGCSTRADQRVLSAARSSLQAISQHLGLIAGGMDSALVVGLTCHVGCSTRADQRVLSAARSSLL
ncbi:unnamed protein product [Staurois parvus]|uniref:Uncharacterized protein n=1 Tax=Staurois parvus TaxID=386267 RepID=A0ABN9DU91_9NEOB|nr:unnamed protein product [Staurois parvus]